MSEAEYAYNQGIDAAKSLLSAVYDALPPHRFAIGPSSLSAILEDMEGLKFLDPVKEAPGWFPNAVCAGVAR